MSDSVRPHRQQPTRLPCPWDSPGKNTGAGCHFLLQIEKAVDLKAPQVTNIPPRLRTTVLTLPFCCSLYLFVKHWSRSCCQSTFLLFLLLCLCFIPQQAVNPGPTRWSPAWTCRWTAEHWWRRIKSCHRQGLSFQLPLGSQSEKAMAPHSSTLAWKIPWMEEPGGLQSMRSLGVGHD